MFTRPGFCPFLDSIFGWSMVDRFFPFFDGKSADLCMMVIYKRYIWWLYIRYMMENHSFSRKKRNLMKTLVFWWLYPKNTPRRPPFLRRHDTKSLDHYFDGCCSWLSNKIVYQNSGISKHWNNSHCCHCRCVCCGCGCGCGWLMLVGWLIGRSVGRLAGWLVG